MAIMIPPAISPDIKSNAEKNIFEWFKNAIGTEDWVVLHSLGIANHCKVIHGETDFLVIAPNLGIFALEVKGGRVKRKLGKWSYINKYGDVDTKVRGPFDQAWEGIYSIRTSIETKLDSQHQNLKNLMFGIGVMFPDIDYDTVGVDEEPWQVFDINDGKNVRAFVERIGEGAENLRKRLNCSEDYILPTKDDVLYIANILRGDFDRKVPLSIKQKYTEEDMLTLTREQSLCIEQLEDNARCMIKGTAGTGKTLLAIEAAKRASSSGEKVAFFCFNKTLGEWLNKYFEDFPQEVRPMFVGTFHSYMIRLLNSKGISFEIPNDSKERNDFYNEILPKLVIQSKVLINYDRIIVDEAQDLMMDLYLEVMNDSLMNGLNRGKWIMFGDFSMQSIYIEGISEKDLLVKLEKETFFATFKLTRNCRNTKKICIDIENIVGIPENSALEDIVGSPAVDHVIYSNEEDQKMKLIEIITSLIQKNISKKDIVILSPKKREDSVVNLIDGITIKDYSAYGAGNISYSTIQGFKGLESSSVILTDIESYENKKLIYVGLSRARFDLHVLETQKAADERKELFFKRRFGYGG